MGKMTREQAEKRLVEIAFKFQGALLSFVHDGEAKCDLSKLYTKKEAEDLADEIQRLHHYF